MLDSKLQFGVPYIISVSLINSRDSFCGNGIMVTFSIRGQLFQVTGGYRNPPTGKYLGVELFDSVNILVLEICNMHLVVFNIITQYLVITLLIH